MRITICTGPILPVPAVAGGAVHRFWGQMAPEFVSAGHKVALFARAWPGQATSEQWRGVEVRRMGGYAHSGNLGWNLWRSWLHARRVVPQLPQADILVTNDILLPRVAASRPECGKLVVALGRHPKGQFRWYPRVDGIAAASEAVRASVERRHPELVSRIEVLPYAIDTTHFHARGPETRMPGSILFAGRIHPEKGLDLLVDSIRELAKSRPDARLTCIGPWRENQGGAGQTYRDALRARARGLPVQWLEPEFEPSRLASIYRSHAVFAYPSLADQGETFGLAPLEAMACGAIPVVSSLPCFRDFLTAGIHGEVFDASGTAPEQALAHALDLALANQDRYRESSIARAEAFAIRTVADRWLRAFEHWLSSK